MSKIWKKYPSVKRLGHSEVGGILDCKNIFIEPKIDGANAAIWVEDGVVRCAKRSGPVTPDDNGFRGLETWVKDNLEKLSVFFASFPHYVLFGEWLVPHTIKYIKEAYNEFYAFDILNSKNGVFIHPIDRVNLCVNYDLLCVPIIKEITGPCYEVDTALLQYDFLGARTPEGIVIKGYNGRVMFSNKWGETHWAKVINPKFSEEHKGTLPKEHESMFAQMFVTSGRVEKVKQKILESREGEWQDKYIGELIGRVYDDAVHEELVEFIKKKKPKCLNIDILKKCCANKTKEIIFPSQIPRQTSQP